MFIIANYHIIARHLEIVADAVGVLRESGLVFVCKGLQFFLELFYLFKRGGLHLVCHDE